MSATMKQFLEWADDKITVVWCYGALCNSESLRKFVSDYDMSDEPINVLNRIVSWVADHEYNKDSTDDDEVNEYVFSFFNDELGEEYDEYQEENFTPEEVMEIYEKTMNVNDESAASKRARYDILDELQDILLDEKDFKRADRFINENEIDMSECDVVMENAIGFEDEDVAEYLIKKGMKMDDKLEKYLKSCNKEFQNYMNKIRAC